MVIGGLGSVRGALVGSLGMGLVDNINAIFLPEFGGMLVFALLILFLLVMPRGIWPESGVSA